MRILVAQIYGLGNAILTTPLIQALASMGDEKAKIHEVHVVVDSKRKSAIEVFKSCPGVKKIWHMGQVHEIQRANIDAMIMCCDYKPLIDRFRIPRIEWGYLRRTGRDDRAAWFQKWPMHEMEMAFKVAKVFGYMGEMPTPHVPVNDKLGVEYLGPKLALGIGYYKGDKWSKSKHWGNDRFAELAKRMQMLGGHTFILGDEMDQKVDGKVIKKLAGRSVTSLCGKLGLRGTFGALKSCDIYVGNDTGLSHAAAAMGMPALSVFKPWASSFVKNRPYGPRGTYACEWSGQNVLDAVWQWVTYEIQQTEQERSKKVKA